MASGIYVENLPPDITEEGLRDLFGQIGDVQSVKIKTDLITHRPTGRGFVEMSLDVDAFRAINCFDGAFIKERRLRLKEAKPLIERARDLWVDRGTLLQDLRNGLFRDSRSH